MPVVNKHFGLCRECNNIRLHGNKWGKKPKESSHKVKKEPKKSLSAPENSIEMRIKHIIDNPNKRLTHIVNAGRSCGKNYAMDILTYAEVFKRSEHKCEECGAALNDVFQDENGKVIANFRYSHIVPKSIAPELRYNPENFNNLCLADHMKWENGDKKSMKIYKKNKEKFPNYIK